MIKYFGTERSSIKQENMAECLRARRVAEREFKKYLINAYVVKHETEIYLGSIKKLILK